MGINYYARSNCCKECGKYEEEHIGKSSMGWQFSFHATDELKCCKDWFTFLQSNNVKVFDEYNREVSFDDFKELVEIKQRDEKLNHAKKNSEGGSYVDSEGYSMSPYEFS